MPLRSLTGLLILFLGGPVVADELAGFSGETPEGIFRVTIVFGGDDVESVTTCKGEARRTGTTGSRSRFSGTRLACGA
jgi:hypothetical protein